MARLLVKILFGLTVLVLVMSALWSRVDGDRVFRTGCTEDMACWNCQTMGNRVCGSN